MRTISITVLMLDYLAPQALYPCFVTCGRPSSAMFKSLRPPVYQMSCCYYL